MALPRAPEARQFLQSAKQRLRDAEVLLEAGRTTGAVYLAGYAVECALKALLLDASPRRKRSEVLDTFRSAKAHDYRWLKTRYLETSGLVLPREVGNLFSVVSFWNTKIRYQASAVSPSKADLFLKSAMAILHWAEGRF